MALLKLDVQVCDNFNLPAVAIAKMPMNAKQVRSLQDVSFSDKKPSDSCMQKTDWPHLIPFGGEKKILATPIFKSIGLENQLVKCRDKTTGELAFWE